MTDRKKSDRHRPRPLKKTLRMREGDVWSYEVGGKGVRIRTPDMKKTTYVKIEDVVDDLLAFLTYDRQAVKPHVVAKYIRENRSRLL